MELNKRTIRYFETVLEGSVTKEESADIIVPDMFPDILRIVDTSGLSVVKDKNARDGAAEVFGMVRATVLYVPEGARGLRKMDVSLPFSHVFEGRNVGPDCKVTAKVSLLSAEARTMNPRKVQVAVSVQLEVSVFGAQDWTVCEGVQDPAEASVQTRVDAQSAYMPVALRDKVFSVVDEMEIPGSRPAASEILKADVKLLTQDVKPIGNKLVLKGAAVAKVLYLGDGALASVEQELPFSQILEMERLEDGCDCAVDLTLTGLDMELRAGLSGESRLISVSLQIDAQARASMDHKIMALADAYSTSYDLLPEFHAVEVSHLLDKSTRRQAVREMVEAGQPVHSVMDAQVFLGPVQTLEEENRVILRTDALLKVIYIGEDQEYYALSRRLPVEYSLEAPAGSRCRAAAQVAAEVLAGATHEGIEARFSVDFDVMVTQPSHFSAVGAINVDLNSPKDHANRPSVVLRRCQLGETLWDIAKKHNTTCADIARANALEEKEELSQGRLLLIPRRR